MDQIAGRLAREGISAVAIRQRGPFVDGDAAGGGNEASVEGGRSDVRAERVNPARRLVVRNILDLLREGEVGISFQVSGLQNDLLNVFAIRTNKFVPEAVESLAELRRAGGFRNLIRARTETAINAIEENGRALRMSRRSDLGGGET